MDNQLNIIKHEDFIVDSAAHDQRQPQNWIDNSSKKMHRFGRDGDEDQPQDDNGFEMLVKDFENKMANTFRSNMNEAMQYLKKKNENVKKTQVKLNQEKMRMFKEQENFERQI